MSDYDAVQKSSLKLKGVSQPVIHKKKKKSKKRDDKEHARVELALESESVEGNSTSSQEFYSKKTKAEISFLKRKERLDADRIRKKASESHKDRVEKFNNYLNNLTEHFEQAKVSWTK